MENTSFRPFFWILSILFLLSACTAAKATPTPTPLPPSATIPPTPSPLPPTSTIPPHPTNAPQATYTPLPTPRYPTWTPAPTAIPYPVGRAYAQIIYNPKADKALMYSGTTIENPGNSSYEAWLFDPQFNQWKKASYLPSGCEWFDFGGVYDSQADRFLLYCSGDPQKGQKGKLVEYDFATDTWSDRQSANTPQDAHITRMAYDAESKKTILVGGISITTAAQQFNETWAYDYASNAWTKMSPKTQPPGLYAHTLVYDSESDRVVLWGGCIWVGNWGSTWKSTVPENLVWAYDYNADAWQSFPVTDGPIAPKSDDWLQYIGSAFIPDLDRILYYWEDQFWSYDYNHNAWEKAKGDVVSNAGFRHSHVMAYLASSQRLLVFGGNPEDWTNFYNDTWLYYPPTGDWAQVGP
jgi:hypothetical protein